MQVRMIDAAQLQVIRGEDQPLCMIWTSGKDVLLLSMKITSDVLANVCGREWAKIPTGEEDYAFEYITIDAGICRINDFCSWKLYCAHLLFMERLWNYRNKSWITRLVFGQPLKRFLYLKLVKRLFSWFFIGVLHELSHFNRLREIKNYSSIPRSFLLLFSPQSRRLSSNSAAIKKVN